MFIEVFSNLSDSMEILLSRFGLYQCTTVQVFISKKRDQAFFQVILKVSLAAVSEGLFCLQASVCL